MPDCHASHDLGKFISLLTEHQSVLRSYITQLIPNASDVRDVLQITNVALWEKRNDFTQGTNFKAWSMAVARYRAMEHRRKMKKDQILVFDEDLLATLEKEYDDELEQTEKMKIALEMCLGKLKPRDAKLIFARYDQSIPLAEYAKADGRT